MTSKRAPTRRWLIACPPSIQPACHTPAISFCPTCTFLSKLPVHQQMMDSSQSPSHNGINATTQESTGGREEIPYSTPLSEMFARDPKVCNTREKKEEQKLFQNKETERPMTFTNSLFSQINLNNAGENSKEKILLTNKSNFKALVLFIWHIL